MYTNQNFVRPELAHRKWRSVFLDTFYTVQLIQSSLFDALQKTLKLRADGIRLCLCLRNKIWIFWPVKKWKPTIMEATWEYMFCVHIHVDSHFQDIHIICSLNPVFMTSKSFLLIHSLAYAVNLECNQA